MKCLLLASALLLLTGCRQALPSAVDSDHNAVYYWRTDLQLNSTERAFLEQHDISKVYCRYFDVVMTPEGPMPNATITFSDTLPQGVELIPTVFITEDCMHSPQQKLAEKLVKRIRQMNETNDIKGVSELQIDCDYTANSRIAYYQFLQQVNSAWHITQEVDSRQPALVSATIRLHQLAMPVPPVDYGVLMLYNTGDPRRFTERNPVLDIRDVAPYLRYLSGYPLPLCAAYPVYRWQRNIHGVRVEHTVADSVLLQVKKAVEYERPELRHTILTYHLDQENIQRYDRKTYEAIYHH